MTAAKALSKGPSRSFNLALSGPGSRRRTVDETLYDDLDPSLKSLTETLLSNSEKGAGMIDEVATAIEEAEAYRLRDSLLTARQPLSLLNADTVSLIPSTTTPSTGFKIANLITDESTGFLMFEDIDRVLVKKSREQERMLAHNIRLALLKSHDQRNDPYIASLLQQSQQHTKQSAGGLLQYGSPETLFRSRAAFASGETRQNPILSHLGSAFHDGGPRSSLPFPDLGELVEGSLVKPEFPTTGPTTGSSTGPTTTTSSTVSMNDLSEISKQKEDDMELKKSLAAIADATQHFSQSSEEKQNPSDLDAVEAAALQWKQEKETIAQRYKETFARLDPYDPSSGGLMTRPLARGKCYRYPRRVYLQGIDHLKQEQHLVGPEDPNCAKQIMSAQDILAAVVHAGSSDLFNPSEAAGANKVIGNHITASRRANMTEPETDYFHFGPSNSHLPPNWAECPYDDDYSAEFLESLALRRGLLALTRKQARENLTKMKTKDTEASLKKLTSKSLHNISPDTENNSDGSDIHSLVDGHDSGVDGLSLKRQIEYTRALQSLHGSTINSTIDDGDEEVLVSMGLSAAGDGSSGGPSLAFASSSIENLTRLALESRESFGASLLNLESRDLYATQDYGQDEHGTDSKDHFDTKDHESTPFSSLSYGNEFSRLEQSYEELSRQLVQGFLRTARLYVTESNLSKRVREWQDIVQPLLREQENRGPFDIHSYGLGVIESIKNSPEHVRTMTLPEMPEIIIRKRKEAIQKRKARGEPIDEDDFEFNIDPTIPVVTLDLETALRNKKSYEVCRIFLATLQLANSGNVEIAVDPQAPYNPNSTDKPSILDPTVSFQGLTRTKDRNGVSKLVPQPLIPNHSIQLKLLSDRFRHQEELATLTTEKAHAHGGDELQAPLPPSRYRRELQAKASRKAKTKSGKKSATIKSTLTSELDQNDSFVVSDSDEEAMQPVKPRSKKPQSIPRSKRIPNPAVTVQSDEEPPLQSDDDSSSNSDDNITLNFGSDHSDTEKPSLNTTQQRKTASRKRILAFSDDDDDE